MDWNKLIQAYALKNALEHEGKAQENKVISALFHEGLKQEEVKNVLANIKETVNKINSWNTEEQKAEYSKVADLTDARKVREGLPELERKGRVILRFAPYPSGPLHIGNARTAVLNDYYAKKYKRKLLLIIDDTIGSEEKPILKEAYKLIPEGLNWLGVKYKKPIIYRSDRLKIYYQYAEKLIKKEKAYVCNCSKEKIRKNRVEMKECSCRHFEAKDQLIRWKKMFKEANPEEAVLRIKTSMQANDPAFRDRILFRIVDRPHPRINKKYRVWPMLDFSNAIDDHLLKITHIIRGKDLRIESDMEKFIWDIFNWNHPEIIHNGLINIKGVKLSKSKGQKEVKAGIYSGWDDPRTWSLQSLEKRGFEPEAIRAFLLEFGLTEREGEASVEILYSKNRELAHNKAEKIEFKQGKGNAKIIMDNGSIVLGSVKPGKLKKGIYHLLKFGYCNLANPGKINEFWFSHL